MSVCDQIEFDQRRADEVLNFWLDDVGPSNWYEIDPELDKTIESRFRPAWIAARDGRLSVTCQSPRAALAHVILLDQFPRNMFRGTADAFATDALATRTAKQAIAAELDLEMAEPERQFFYLPLMHCECLTDQERCVRLILTRMPQTSNQNLEHAIQHREVIRRFGRFPSRNAALGRADSDAEQAYRAQGGYMS